MCPLQRFKEPKLEIWQMDAQLHGLVYITPSLFHLKENKLKV